MQRRYGVTIKDAPTALWEASDLANGGTSVAGSFIQTLPLVNRDGSHVVEAIKRAQSLFPWLLRGVDFDNDSAFMNELVVPWCREQKLEVTRSRGRARRDLLQAMDKLEADGQPPATSASDFQDLVVFTATVDKETNAKKCTADMMSRQIYKPAIDLATECQLA